jgi:hypothetical protein
MEGTSWTMSRNYFTSETGRVVTQWPYGSALYGAMTKALSPFSETARRRTAEVPRRDTQHDSLPRVRTHRAAACR